MKSNEKFESSNIGCRRIFLWNLVALLGWNFIAIDHVDEHIARFFYYMYRYIYMSVCVHVGIN